MKTVTRKAEWPDWTPPPEMLKRRPDLPRFHERRRGKSARRAGPVSGLFALPYSRHQRTGHTIGTNVSSGCIRMMNEDVTDLYGRVHVGTKVVVM